MTLLARQPWLNSIEKRLRKPVALFLDFDGTLASIVPRPDDAWLLPSTRDLLKLLSRRVPVAIVSGRSLRDLRSRIGLKGVTYVGNHGLEVAGQNLRFKMKDAAHWRAFLIKIGRQLDEDLGKIPGILLENKGYTLSVHYRLAGGQARQKARRLFAKRLQPYQVRNLVRLRRGKAVWEVRPPVLWDKGTAVRWVLKQPGFRGRWPLFIGDDETDKDVFRAIWNYGIGIFVGASQENGTAHYRLKDPIKVHGFLKWLLRQLMHREVRIYGQGSYLRNGGR